MLALAGSGLAQLFLVRVAPVVASQLGSGDRFRERRPPVGPLQRDPRVRRSGISGLPPCLLSFRLRRPGGTGDALRLWRRAVGEKRGGQVTSGGRCVGLAVTAAICDPSASNSRRKAAGDMIGEWRIEGHAIVSDDDRIADANGETPAELRNDADWARFQTALDTAAVTVVGRLGHAAHPNTKGRSRLVLSSGAKGIERRADAWWWNPARGATRRCSRRSGARRRYRRCARRPPGDGLSSSPPASTPSTCRANRA